MSFSKKCITDNHAKAVSKSLPSPSRKYIILPKAILLQKFKAMAWPQFRIKEHAVRFFQKNYQLHVIKNGNSPQKYLIVLVKVVQPVLQAGQFLTFEIYSRPVKVYVLPKWW